MIIKKVKVIQSNKSFKDKNKFNKKVNKKYYYNISNFKLKTYITFYNNINIAFTIVDI